MMLWVGFNAFVLLMLIIDLGIFHRKAHEIRFKEALIWVIVWISLALLFNLGIYLWHGKQAGLEFLTGYLIEKSLSIDNIFLFLTIFALFQVPPKYQHKVLFWGIISALLMRAGFILIGVRLIEKFHWVIYLFGGFLIFTGIKMLFRKETAPKLENSKILRIVRKLVPMASRFHEGRFFVREQGKRLATPLFLVLILIEATDFIFAVDSIPAVLAITPDPFIVYTSNVFAILGLRSLYFALAAFLQLFSYLHYGLAGILIFVGAKMALAGIYSIPIGVSFAVVLAILVVSILASIIWPKEPPLLLRSFEFTTPSEHSWSFGYRIGAGFAFTLLLTTIMVGTSIYALRLAEGSHRTLTIFIICGVAITLMIGLAILITQSTSRLYELSQQSILAREELLTTIAHDLKNPLAAIQLSAQTLAQHADQDQFAREQAKTICDSTRQMADLINDLLDLEKLETKRFPINLAAQDASHLVAEAAESQRPFALKKNIKLHADVEPGLPIVRSDREQLFRVFANLVENALRFTGAGGAITIGAKLDQNMVRFFVSDTGRGIEPDEVSHLFDRYWRSKNINGEHGTGLGLSIVKGIVEAHGGRVWVDTKLGEGTTFNFTIPVQMPPALGVVQENILRRAS